MGSARGPQERGERNAARCGDAGCKPLRDLDLDMLTEAFTPCVAGRLFYAIPGGRSSDPPQDLGVYAYTPANVFAPVSSRHVGSDMVIDSLDVCTSGMAR